ncbi:hypothetical protein SERLADRAFT_466566 [Serpula lacrymans var. lacrymans S7.9]|uniref:C4-dicarboxylate transporter/malic acid transport protein n=1 Tax=Serpula lacrymans var. lacrymans (strain S7.9) TaxID=578457 RepID=F8NUE2_SERL9|nr:uncharacterized protein SERLADRAFT_466566 [Serpula lacrymans var. lacrymans S7.9]EGO25854.1 hypothetical protein SERLADRAFT_466566 [Serpula lacrymans var. lacrymans S7.9]
MATTSPRKSWKECIRHFTPAWHTVIMGTGAVSALVHSFPYGSGSLPIKIVTLLVFFLNLFLFVVICAATIARYILFPELWPIMLRHPAQSLFIGAFPMGAATLINVALVANQEWGFAGTGFLYTLWGLWWLDSVISFAVAFGMVYTMMIKHDHAIPKMSAIWLLPVVTLIVASSTGGLLSAAIKPHTTTIALLTTSISFTMVIIGLSLAMMMITVYLTRLITNGPPEVNLILSAFVVLGPLGQGGYSLLVNGQDLSELLPLHLNGNFPSSALAGQMIYAVCFCGAYALWSMGICWILIAILSILNIVRKEKMIPFSIAYWGLVFPNAVYALLSVQLGKVLNSDFFLVFGTIWSIIVFILWIVIFFKTIPAVMDRSIFKAPCLADATLLPFSEKDMHSGTAQTSTGTSLSPP